MVGTQVMRFNHRNRHGFTIDTPDNRFLVEATEWITSNVIHLPPPKREIPKYRDFETALTDYRNAHLGLQRAMDRDLAKATFWRWLFTGGWLR